MYLVWNRFIHILGHMIKKKKAHMLIRVARYLFVDISHDIVRILASLESISGGAQNNSDIPWEVWQKLQIVKLPYYLVWLLLSI